MARLKQAPRALQRGRASFIFFGGGGGEQLHTGLDARQLDELRGSASRGVWISARVWRDWRDSSKASR